MFCKHSIWVVVSLLLFVSIIARVAFFSSQNLSLYWDEVAIAVEARSVAHFGHDIHGNHWLQPLYPSYGDYKHPGLIIIVSFLYRLLPEYDWLVRIPSLVSGLLTICLTAYLTFVITKRYGSQTPKLHRLKLMVSTAFVVGISPWAFHFSLVGFESMLAQALVLISIASLLQGFIRKQAYWYAVALFFGIAASYTYYAAQYIWPVIFMMLCILEVSNKSLKQIMSSIGTAVGVLLLFYVALVPMYFSEHFTSSQIVRMSTDSVLDITTFVQTANEVQTVATSKLDSILFNRRVFILRQLLENVFSHLDPRYLFFTGDSNMRHGSGVSGLFNLTMLLPLLVGMSWLFSKSKKLGFSGNVNC